jgi:putative phage-type endonuclease
MNKFKHVIPTWDMPEEEWLAFRANGLGGSDAGTVCGVNKYKSAYALWAERTGQIERDNVGNDATKWGNRLERVVAEAYAEDYNMAVVEWPVILVSEDNPFMFANVDFCIVTPCEEFPAGVVTSWKSVEVPGCVERILEIKTSGIASPGTAHQWNNNSVPLGYMLQGYHYGIVTGIKAITFAALLPPLGLQVREMEWDEEIAENLIAAEQTFWDLVETKQAPPADGSEATESAQAKRYPRHEEGKGYEGGQALQALWDEFSAAKVAADEADSARKALRAQIIELVGNAEYATVDGNVILTYKTGKDVESLDADRIKREAPEIFEQFKKTRPGARTLRGK